MATILPLLDEVLIGLVPLTSAWDGRTHLVTDESFAIGCLSGEYVALCGTTVLVCSLLTDGAGCRQCAESPVLQRLRLETGERPRRPGRQGTWRGRWHRDRTDSSSPVNKPP